jgi:lysyl-tRNA synthetase class 1
VEESKALHWADLAADRVIRERGDRATYVVAAGVAPSGSITVGHLREVLTAELVVRALRGRGKSVRFIYSWDDYDVFRKVPKNLPQQEMLAANLRKPLADVPSPFDDGSSYAEHFERSLERPLAQVAETPSYRYQAQEYRSGTYATGVRLALAARDRIRALLDEHRTEPLHADWWPISVYSAIDGSDRTTVLSWDGEWQVTYRDVDGVERSVDLRASGAAKLGWRIDWPMRWAHEQVDFEPGGKDHLTAGGSFASAAPIAAEVYSYPPPVSLAYGDIGIKGGRGRISSSSGEVVTIEQMLAVYQPEVLRYLFAGTRPNAEFVVSFDTDVLKLYEDYDRSERIYFGGDEVGEKRAAKERRIYELSQLGAVPERLPAQATFRHVCSLLQIRDGDLDATVTALLPAQESGASGLDADARHRLRVRVACAWHWVNNYAPEEMRFRLRTTNDPPIPLDSVARTALGRLEQTVAELERYDAKSLSAEIYTIAELAGMEPKQLFAAIYAVLIGKERGPRLADFMLLTGRERLAAILAAATSAVAPLP